MQYTLYQYIYFFFLYAFAGWLIEEVYAAIKYGKFVNRGFINGPLCIKYGLCMVLLLEDLHDLSAHPVYQLVLSVVIVAVFEYVTGVLLKLITGKRFWDYSKVRWNLNGYICIQQTLLWAVIAVANIWLVHPFLYMIYELIPFRIMQIILLVLLIILVLDLVATLCSSLKWKIQGYLYGNVAERLEKTKKQLGFSIFTLIQKRMYRAFPEFVEQEKKPEDGFGVTENRIFAKGLCLDKLIWIFVISALVGDWIETIYVWAVSGVLMSRSSLIYGTFSIVWGLGGALATGLLYSLRKKNDRYIFIAGAIMGGVYEYSCSVFTEVVFGTTFWDYSHMPFNINGRINLLFCFFWGIAAIVWLKLLYPGASKMIEMITPVAGKVMTYIVILFMVLNMLVSGLAIGRYVQRKAGNESLSSIGIFLDHVYTDELIENIYPNMKIK